MRKNVFILPFLALLAASCSIRTSENNECRAIAVEVVSIATKSSVSRHTYVGEVEEKNSVSVSAQTPGRLTELRVQRGDKVVKGQVLMVIDSTQASNVLQSTSAFLHQAEDGYARAMTLYREGGLTEQKRVELETKLSQARSVHASAVRALEECTLRATIDGVVGDCRVKVGETVVPGLPLLTIINMDGFVVKFSVPENEVANIHIGESARMSIPAINADDIALTITDKSLTPNKIAHTYELTAAVVERHQLIPGLMAKVTIDTDRVNGYVLPQSCIQLLPEGAKVWVANQDKAERRTITIGQYVNDGVLVVDGLQAGDLIITKGYQKLWQGAEITY